MALTIEMLDIGNIGHGIVSMSLENFMDTIG